MIRRRRSASIDALRARVHRRAQGMNTHELHEWAENCTASLDAHVLNLHKSEAVLNGEFEESRKITAILDEVLCELTRRYV